MRTLDSGATVTEFSLATSEQWKDKNGEKQERTEWHRVVFWGKGGEIVNEYFDKGDPIVITGSMTYEKWIDKNDQKRTTAKVKAQNFEFVPSSSKGTRSSDADAIVKEITQRPKTATTPTPEPADNEKLPF